MTFVSKRNDFLIYLGLTSQNIRMPMLIMGSIRCFLTKNKFLTTLLSRENQHELCVIARKFPNLMVFGCWWFMNNPSLVDEITRERLELLGLSIIPQHSDARILDQLIYKWKHSRQIISRVLVDKYQDLLDSGWLITQDEIGRDVAALLGGNFEGFLQS